MQRRSFAQQQQRLARMQQQQQQPQQQRQFMNVGGPAAVPNVANNAQSAPLAQLVAYPPAATVQQQQQESSYADDVDLETNVNQILELSEATDDAAPGAEVATDAGAGGKAIKPWSRIDKKKPTVRQKRIKRNRSLRKLLTPKNALMALYELKGHELSEFQMQSDTTGFVATLTINGTEFSGRGASKIVAKNDASEKALRDLIIAKMQNVPRGAPASVTVKTEDGGDEQDGDDPMGNGGDASEEEVPMMHLASFALHKLFTEWQAAGYEVPDFRTNPIGPAKTVPAKPQPRKDLPLNHAEMHPAMLLAVMRPQTQYYEQGSEGVTPNVIHHMRVKLEGAEYDGQARSKKAARKAAATAACNELFGSKFEFDKDCSGQRRVVEMTEQEAASA